MNKKLLALVVLSALGTWGGANATDVTIERAQSGNNFAGVVLAGEASINTTASITVTQTGLPPVGLTNGVTAIGRTEVDWNAKNINIDSKSYGIWSEATVHKLTAADTLSIKSEDDAVYAGGGRVRLTGNTVLINSAKGGNALKTNGGTTSNALISVIGDNVTILSGERGAIAGFNGTITVKAENDLVIASNITEDSDGALRYQNAVSADNADVILNAKNITITAEGDNAQNAIASTHLGDFTIRAENTTVNGDIASHGDFDFEGNLLFKGDTAFFKTLTGEGRLYVDNLGQSVTINSVDDVSMVTIAGNGTLNDAAKGSLQTAFNNVTLGEGAVDIELEEGYYNGATSGVLEYTDGQPTITNVKTSANTIMRDTLDIASGSTVMLNRILMNDVHKRMGDLRNNAGMNGAWVRYDGGRLSGGHVANKFNTIQIGADMPFAENFHAGVAASYTRGDVDFTRGGAGMDAYSFAAYGTWFAPNGMYADVVARYGYVKNELTVDHNLKGDLDNNAVALSGEFGWKFDVAKDFFVTPQVEASYMHIDSDNVKLGNEASYKFDSVNSFIGRAGLAAGYTFPNQKGNVFVKASAVHEFAGDSKVTGANGTSLKKDGKDTWAEFGIGAQYNFNKNVQAWANLERTAGADIEEDYRATVGVRINF